LTEVPAVVPAPDPVPPARTPGLRPRPPSGRAAPGTLHRTKAQAEAPPLYRPPALAVPTRVPPPRRRSGPAGRRALRHAPAADGGAARPRRPGRRARPGPGAG